MKPWLIFFFLPVCAHAQSMEGRIVRILDGSNVVFTDTHRHQHYIRLSGIEVPKGRLAASAARMIADLTRGKKVGVDWDKIDDACKRRSKHPSSCPKVGKILVGAEDINLELIRRGLARHRHNFQDEQSTTDRTLYRETEEAARKDKRGIWATGAR